MKTDFFLFLIILKLFLVLIISTCPNNCNQNGYCNENGICECFPSFHGIDCSIRVCPSGVAWFDEPTANNIAHGSFRECSNMGLCNRETGICNCRLGFTGPACNIMSCPQGLASNGKLTACSGHGRCKSLRQAADTTDFVQLFNGSSYIDWDADMIHGCVCDSGWHGVNCSLRTCPLGDDPTSTDLDEVQLIDCRCNDYKCLGSVQLLVRGQTTPSISFNATEEILAQTLLDLYSINQIRVEIIGERFCTKTGSTTVIKFKLPSDGKDVISIFEIFNGTANVYANGLASVYNPSIVSVAGSRQYIECSNHGTCDYSTGICDCFDGYGSSDGFGNIGTRGDCGYQFSTSTSYVIDGITVTSGCPYEYNGINTTKLFCSGQGTCNSMTGTCTCYPGYEGAACKKKTCGNGNAIFGNVQIDHTAQVMCSGIGDCNWLTGKCESCGGTWGLFKGDTCSEMTCYSNGDVDCSGNGVCLTLEEMALLTYDVDKNLASVTYTTPWDSNIIRGCSCFRSWSTDNQYSNSYFPDGNVKQSIADNYDRHKFYRGPYAFSATDWIGADCSIASCPTGLDPTLTSSTYGKNEIQMLQCDANAGYLLLTFRGNTTRPIPYDSTASELETYLEELYTIGNVIIDIVGVETTICTSTNTTIEFVTELGNVPLITVNTTLLDHTSNSNMNQFLANITLIQDGTKIDFECSSMGICNEKTGRCSCMNGYSSSDGTLDNAGERGDCSYYNKYPQ